jgi:hypothetical protein
LVQYLDPWNAEAWAEALLRMATDDLWRGGWEDRATENYASKAWAESAEVVRICIEAMDDKQSIEFN